MFSDHASEVPFTALTSLGETMRGFEFKKAHVPAESETSGELSWEANVLSYQHHINQKYTSRSPAPVFLCTKLVTLIEVRGAELVC